MHAGMPECTDPCTPPAGGRESGLPCHSSKPPLLRVLSAPGGRGEETNVPGAKNCSIPTRPKFKAFWQSHQEPLKKKVL